MIYFQIEIGEEDYIIEDWCRNMNIDFEDFENYLDDFVNDYYQFMPDRVSVI